MEQDLSKIGIIGAGPAGCCCAYFSANNLNKVVLIDYNEPLKTILPTGGGRCNIAFEEFDIKKLANNYPRGEKFLYSLFSKFAVSETIDLFNNLGIKTYTQKNGRIFPVSNSSKEVRDKFLKSLKTNKNIKILREKVLKIEKNNNDFVVITDKNSHIFDKLVIATGGHNGYEIIKKLGISIVDPKPSLVGLVTKENFKNIMGISLNNVKNIQTQEIGDLLFTHFGVSGPLIYKISSIYARKDLPYTLEFDIAENLNDLQKILNENPHKYIKNILSEYIPLKLAEYILLKLNINSDTKAHSLNGKNRDRVLNELHHFTITVTSTKKDGETVTAGGVNLNKINPKTLESKEVEGLYFCGEVMDIDGFCGGFNLQNCWSSGFVCSNNFL